MSGAWETACSPPYLVKFKSLASLDRELFQSTWLNSQAYYSSHDWGTSYIDKQKSRGKRRDTVASGGLGLEIFCRIMGGRQTWVPGPSPFPKPRGALLSIKSYPIVLILTIPGKGTPGNWHLYGQPAPAPPRWSFENRKR